MSPVPASSPPYTGRFAPSPTGPLHFGSLVAALGGYLDARAHGGRWLLRIEDLDPPREQIGAADVILRSLDIHGLHWDGPVLHQHTRLAAYESAVANLSAEGWAYTCACSRREIADSGLRGLEGPVYPGTCRQGPPPGKSARALRIRVPGDETLYFEDCLQGPVRQDLAREIGDFVIRRADGCFAYQLAVVLDDAFQGVSRVVRGVDLLLSTPRQMWLQRRLGLPTPSYMHLPVAVTAAGEKLSKQTGARPLDNERPSLNLFRALEFLRQCPPPPLRGASPPELLSWATKNWQPERLRGIVTGIAQEVT
ncbi:MAG: tRNA glutamyl-Q(34) synthetase GluQRS [Gammaproteobacteria bacterium]|nr:tRNA glutamyl-Q(34) synthetase GluQRS [Gammaproteobacteria bacterium]